MPHDQNRPIRIRYATIADNVLLAELGSQTFSDSFAADNTPQNMATYLATAFSPHKQAEELSDPMSRFLIAELEQSTVGYARLKFGKGPSTVVGRAPMEIARFYARKEWLGKGVGARLMGFCLDEAERENCDVVWLDVWERNARAIAFYRKWDFVQVGTQVFQLGDDPQNDLIMARTV